MPVARAVVAEGAPSADRSAGPAFGRLAAAGASASALIRQSAQRTTFVAALVLGVIVLAAAVVDSADITASAMGNTYYATAVLAMRANLHAFAYASFDASGFVSVDKPPLGLWLQVASSLVFGFSGSALILPEIVAAVLCVLLAGAVAWRAFGPRIGLIAAAVMLLTPVVVIVARDNVLDAPLALLSLLAMAAGLRAMETGRLRPLLLAAMCVGLAFNVKFLEAFLVAPAIGIAFLATAPATIRRRLAIATAAAAVGLVVAASWLTFVGLTPAADRPYIGSTTTNSPLELVVGYDGLHRLLYESTSTADAAVGAGNPSPLRLVAPGLGGEIGWFVPLAVAGAVLAMDRLRRRRRAGRAIDQADRAALAFSIWFATDAVCFSLAGFISPYYLAEMAAPVAVLAAIGAVLLWRAWRAGHRSGVLLPAVVIAEAVESVVVLGADPAWLPGLAVLIVGIAMAGSAILGGSWLARRRGRRRTDTTVTEARAAGRGRPRGWPDRAGLLLAALAISVGPALWCLASLREANAGSHPAAGPLAVGDQARNPPYLNARMTAFLVAHRGSSTFVAATEDAADATPIVFNTGLPVMTMGGFSGRDPILTAQTLAARIAGGDVRFVYLPIRDVTPTQFETLYPGATPPTLHPEGKVARWVAATCVPLAPRLWTSSHTVGNHELFDCRPAAG